MDVKKSGVSPAYLLVKKINIDIDGVEPGKIIETTDRNQIFESTHFSERTPFELSSNSSFSIVGDEVIPWAMKERLVVDFPVQGGGHIMQADGVKDDDYMISASHSKEGGLFHAVDIVADMGERVVAAGPGVVVSVQDGYPDAGCDDSRFGMYDNRVIVLHEDGLEATYGHLMKGSVSVSPGGRVEAGEMIGKVGNSGASFVPHLHFQVGGMNSHGYMTFPLKFRCGGKKKIPEVGHVLCDLMSPDPQPPVAGSASPPVQDGDRMGEFKSVEPTKIMCTGSRIAQTSC